MKNLFLISILSLFILTSCRKDENPRTENLRWEFTFESDNTIDAVINDPIIYEDIVIIPRISFRQQKPELIALNKITGKELWRWSEAWEKYKKDGFSIRSYAYDGILAIGDNNYSAGLDIYTGETLWENLDTVHGRAGLTGAKDQIFKSALIPDQKYWIQKANIYTGEWENIYEFDKEPGFNLGSSPVSVIEWENKTYLTFHRTNWRSQPSHESQYFLNFFNVTDDSLAWETDTIPIQFPISPTPGAFPAFSEGQIMLANECIYSYNISDGSLKWKNTYDNTFVFATPIITYEGKVYGKNGDGYLLCLDVHTGREIFRTDTGGLPSTMNTYDGKIYMSGVFTHDGRVFMIIDANTGEVLNSFTGPGNQNIDTNVLQSSLTVDQETGVAYAATYNKLYCYDFE